MQFEERKLPPYSEPISSTQAVLREGSVYFLVNYVRGDMTIPTMETLVFIGRNLESGDAGKVYFQDVLSYRRGNRYGRDDSVEGDEADVVGRVFCGSEDEMHDMFEYERALEGLIRCSLRRRGMETESDLLSEQRELNAYPEPVSLSDLEEGSFYFVVTYADAERLIPVMDTRVFVGRNLEAGDEGKLYFQDADSYLEGLRYGSPEEDDCTIFYTDSESQLDHVFDFEHALEELMRCSLRRRGMTEV